VRLRIPLPNYTQVPNDLFDHWLPHLNESELKVLLVVIRQTLGYHKQADVISHSQIQKKTGLSKANCLIGVKSLISKGVIRKTVHGVLGTEQVSYELIFAEEPAIQPIAVEEGGGIVPILGGVSQQYPQKKETKEKEQQQKPSAAAVFSKAIEDKLQALGVTKTERKKWNYSEAQVSQAFAVTGEVPRDNPLKTFRAALKDGWEPTKPRRKKGQVDIETWVRGINANLPKDLHVRIEGDDVVFLDKRFDGHKNIIVKSKLPINNLNVDLNKREQIQSNLKQIVQERP